MNPNPTPVVVKPGYKTTEFWLTLLTVALSTVAPLVGNYPRLVQGIGIALSVLATLGYTASRTSVKNSVL